MKKIHVTTTHLNPHKDSCFFEISTKTNNEVFDEARDFIEKVHKLKLSTIELFHLRRLACLVTTDTSLILKNATHLRDSFHVVSPWQETAARFFLEFYGLTPALLHENPPHPQKHPCSVRNRGVFGTIDGI
jgi:hypothetical protein